MNTDESDLVGDVLDSWEELEDNTVLDKKLKEIKTSADEKKRLSAQGMVTDSSDRTQYQPQVKILKRQTDTAATSNDKRSNIPTKTLEQREAEYAEARLRILGPAYGNGDGNEEEPQERSPEESTVREFYCTMTETMIKKFPFQDKVLQGIGFLNPLSKDKLSPEDVISLSDRFRNYNQQETSQLEDEAAEYILTPLCDLPAFDPDTPSLNQFWTSIGNLKLPSGKQQFQHLFALSKVVLAVPHSNADTERTFSMLKKIQSDSRDNLADKTIHSLLSVKINNPTVSLV